MNWAISFHRDFVAEFQTLRESVQVEALARLALLAEFGPGLGRPAVDTLKSSRYANLKELRFDVDRGVWRMAFAFDARRRAILLVAGNKAGISERLFYRRLIHKAEMRLEEHIRELKASQTAGDQ